MEIHQLEQFKAIAECATMREAAKKLYVSQPALSQNLKKLEGELGCALFTRSHNQLSLTAYGEILLEHTHRILFDLREVRDEIEEQKRLEAQTIRVGSFYWPLTMFLMPQVAVNFPRLTFEVVTKDSKEAICAVRDGLLDIALLTGAEAAPGLQERLVFEEGLLLSVPSASVLATRESLEPEDLRAVPLMVPCSLLGLAEWYEAYLAAGGVGEDKVERLETKRYLENMDSTTRAHFTTSFVAAFSNPSSSRVSIPLSGPLSARSLKAVWRPGDGRVAEVADYLTDESHAAFGNRALLPFLLFRDAASNLVIREN